LGGTFGGAAIKFRSVPKLYTFAYKAV